jgi:hypothetical protein
VSETILDLQRIIRTMRREAISSKEGIQTLAGVRITVDGAEERLVTVTDSLGNFTLDPAISKSRDR